MPPRVKKFWTVHTGPSPFPGDFSDFLQAKKKSKLPVVPIKKRSTCFSKSSQALSTRRPDGLMVLGSG